MILAGLNKLSLIDYPDKLACIVFTQGCNFHCPFCYNVDLITVKSQSKMAELAEIRLKGFWDFLSTRAGKLDGVVITGGEPTVQPDLLEFMRKIKEAGFLVKLDSNGTRPDVLKQSLDQKLVDYIAMDIKHVFDKYDQAVGRRLNINSIKESIALIQTSNIDYEFRSTIIPGIHSPEDVKQMVTQIKGSTKYYLQMGKNTPTFKITTPSFDLFELKEEVKDLVGYVGVRF